MLVDLQRMLFKQEYQSIALIGLGGIGKTQVALQFAYLVKKNEREYSIFWVPAYSEGAFEQVYTEMAKQLDVNTAKPDEDLRESVRQYLSSKRSGKWLLIVDNADDKEIVFGSHSKPGGIKKFLPVNENGRVLFTTRFREVAILAETDDTIELEQLELQGATELLKSRLRRKDLLYDEIVTRQLLDELTYLPLAITQVAAYLSRNFLSIQKYLKLLRGTEQDIVGLISRDFPDSTRYPSSQNAIATTWLVSFDQIRKFHSNAADLLSFMSCIELKTIPQSLLPRSISEEEFEFAIGMLCGYAFLVRREGSRIFDMHNLVHLAAKIWLQRNKDVEKTTINAIHHLITVFLSQDQANREIWREYLPHTLRVLHESKDCEIERKYNLFHKVGLCLSIDRRFKEAIICFQAAFTWQTQTVEEEDHSRLASENVLASAYLNDRRIKDAIAMLEHVVEVQKKMLVEENYFRLASEHLLASAYKANK